jgi:hypothetical protein
MRTSNKFKKRGDERMQTWWAKYTAHNDKVEMPYFKRLRMD